MEKSHLKIDFYLNIISSISFIKIKNKFLLSCITFEQLNETVGIFLSNK